MIRKNCHYYDWFGDYSLDTCTHPKVNCSNPECRNCPYHISEKDYQIKDREDQISVLQNEILKLKKKK